MTREEQEKREVVVDCLEFLGDEEYGNGGAPTLRELFEGCEAMGASVFWSCWSEAELNAPAWGEEV